MAASYLANVEADLSCSLCLELFIDPHTPKELDCPHVYCHKCLDKLVEGGNRSVNPFITCPECRLITVVPLKSRKSKGGIAALKTSIRLRSLAENHLKYTKSSVQVKECLDARSVPFCAEHDGEKMHFYCVTCKVLACQACLVLNHKRPKHVVKGVKEAHKAKLKSMSDVLGRSEAAAIQCEREATFVALLEAKIRKSMTLAESEIDQIAANAIVYVNDQSVAMKAQLRGLNDKQLQKCREHRETLETVARGLRNTVADTKSITENATSYEYLKQLEEKIKVSQKVKNNGKDQTNGVLKFKTYKMVQEPMSELGKIAQVRKLYYSTHHSIGGFNAFIRSFDAGSDGKLAVCLSHQVHIYSKQQTGQYEKQLSLALTKNPNKAWDVVFAADGGYLVARGDNVEMYSVSGRFERTVSTVQDDSSDADKDIRRIITLPDRRIVVGDYGRRVLTVHTSDGELFMVLNIIIEPWCIAPMKGSQVAICSWEKVCVIDLDSGKETLNITDILDPRSICYDEETNCLLVGSSDWNGEARNRGVVDQYCVATGKFIARIAEGFGESEPQTMTFTDDRMLAVAKYDEVEIYEVY